MEIFELIAEHQAEIEVALSRIEVLRAAQLRMSSDATKIAELQARIAVLEARVVAPPVERPLWSHDFDAILPFGIHARSPGRVTLVDVGGRHAARLLTLPGDSQVNGSGTWERCDLRLSQELTDGYEGREAWWSHSVTFPDDFVQPPRSEAGGEWHGGLVFDFHNTADAGGQANYQVAVYPATAISPDRKTGMWLELHAGNPADPVKLSVAVQKGAITKNKRYDFKSHVRWAADSTGFFRAWVDGVQYMNHKGPTLYTGEGVYLKLANYHSPFGKATAVLHAGIKRGATEASVA